jgi:hypothetical protein
MDVIPVVMSVGTSQSGVVCCVLGMDGLTVHFSDSIARFTK